jgi:hypothetical protein
MGLKHVEGRVIIKIDLEEKNWHTFSNGLRIRRERRYNEFNRRITEPVNATVVSADNIPEGSEILIQFNEICDTNKIFNYQQLSGDEIASSVKYYSINEEQCFLWRENKSEKWKPLKNFATALRVFKPYSGNIAGIKPLQIKDVLYLTSGEFEGYVMNTLKASDYEIIFQTEEGREGRIIRTRHYEGRWHDREEMAAINYELTDLLLEGKLLIGLETSDAKTIKEIKVA